MASRRSWQVQVNSRTFHLMRGEDLKPGETAVESRIALQWIERVLHRFFDGRQYGSIRQALAAIGVRAGAAGNAAELKNAIVSGKLVLVAASSGGLNALIPEQAAKVPVAEQIKSAKEKKTWVEFAVVDHDGTPAAGSRYTCMLPDGKVHEGILDSKGLARFDEIDPGNCVFVLSDLHKDEWRNA
jgi:hypothetical protein